MDETFNNYQTMSITSLGPITLDQGQTNPFAAAKSTNFLDDIEGARTKSKHNQFTNKKPFLQSDVQGSTSKQLIRARNCRDNSLYIDDIDGTRHTIKDRMMRTNRHIDPLMPAYPLPSYAADSHVVPRFIKDPQRHDDIEGSSVKPTKVFAVKDTMSVSDIEGAQADWRPVHTALRLKNQPHDIMANRDIVERKRFIDRTQRQTDPCNPVYYINGMSYSDDKYSRPRALKPYIADNMALKTQDIVGATPGSLHTTVTRSEYRNTNYIGDIAGAQADSTKHSIVTTRQTNPLAPVYRALDPDELLYPLIAPLIPPSMVSLPTIPPRRKSDNGSTTASVKPGLSSSSRERSRVDGEAERRQSALNLNFGSLLSTGPSPAVSTRHSGRGSSHFALTPTQKRAETERKEEIKLVQQLNM